MNMISKKDDEESIDLLMVFNVLKKNIIYIIFIGVLFGSVSYTGTYFLISPKYQAQCIMYVNNKPNSDDRAGSTLSVNDLDASAQLVKTYSVIIKSKPLLKEVKEKAEIELDLEKLKGMISVGSIDGTEVLGITVTDTDQKEAVRIANAITDIAPDFIAEVVEGSSVKIVERAHIPGVAVSPNIPKNAAVGFALGIMLSAVIIIFKEQMDDTVKSGDVFAQWPYPILGQIPDFEGKNRSMNTYYKQTQRKESESHPIFSTANRKQKTMKGKEHDIRVLSENSHFEIQEAYKALRTSVVFSMTGKECKVIVLTSGMQREAKSTTALNLALTLVQNHVKTLLIDCDLRLPTVATSLRLANTTGLSDVLVEKSQVNDVLQHVQNGLDAITAGTLSPNPAELLGSKAMEQLLDELKTRYEYIILDTPPICIVTDAALLSRHADGVIVAVREGVAQQRVVSEALHKIEFAGGKILGFVYTGVSGSRKQYSNYYHSYGYDKKKQESKDEKANRS